MASAENGLSWLGNLPAHPVFNGRLVPLNSLRHEVPRPSYVLQDLGMPKGLTAHEVCQLDQLSVGQRRFKRGECIYTAGMALEALYSVRRGSAKASIQVEDGREQVTGFPVAGELIGFDGIGAGVHQCSASALEDGEVSLIPFVRLEYFARQIPALQHHVNRLLGVELVREQQKMFMLGSLRADERLAWFLLDFAHRNLARGYSASEFVLHMTRADLGSFLGLTLETVCRLFSRFQLAGLIVFRQKVVKVVDRPSLRALLGGTDRAGADRTAGRPY